MNEAPLPETPPAETALRATSTSPPSPKGTSALLVILGVLFAILWLMVHVAWAGLSFVADVMANDSGRADPNQHMSLICGMLGGQILAGAAGIPAGLAFFWRGRRKILLWMFAFLFVIGALIQGSVFYSFFSSMP